MTEEQKEFLIAKMLNAPSSLSDEELDLLANDEELRDIYEMSSAVSSACRRPLNIDVEEEWKRFQPYIKPKPAPMRLIIKVAAIFLGVILALAIVVKILDKSLTKEPQPVIVKSEQSVVPEQVAVVREPTHDSSVEPEVTSPMTVKKKQVNKRKQKAKRAAVTESVETEEVMPPQDVNVDEFLRIQQARIDNDLALQTAKIIEEEYDKTYLLFAIISSKDEVTSNTIRRLTAQ